MKVIFRPIAMLLFAVLFFQPVWSQTPVQVTPQLLPPYSLQVSEYYSGIQPKLQVLLLNRDISQPTIQVKLRLTVESQNCRMQTKANAITPTFTLTSGIPYYMSPSELQPFFAAANIDFSGGYTEQQYVQTGRLPEGLYSFFIEAFELNTGNLVSNKGFSLGWLTLADPPLLNTPARAEGVTPANPQNIIFNWTPRHNTSPTAGYFTDYVFSIAEYNDINIGPEASFSSSPPLFIDSVQTTTYLFGPGQPQLVPGKRYAWRVQAKAKSGSVPLAMFRNNGFSEVYWFTYQNNCAAPVGIGHNVQGVRATIEWANNPMHLEWKVEYREKNNPDAQWFTLSNTLPRVMLTDLRPSTQYEYRVGGSCIAGQFTYSALFSFTTAGSPVSPVANCGDSTQVPAGGGQLLQTLNAGDTLRAGTFTVHVGVSSGAGSFTGMGYVKVPWLMNAKVEVRFTNITVSLDRKLIGGVIETTYDPNESGISDIDEYIDIFAGGVGVGGVITGQPADTTVGFPILWPGGIGVTLPPGYNPITGLPAPGTTIPIVLTNAQTGAQTTLQVSHLPTTIQDANGNVYQINANGQVTQVGLAGGLELLQNMNRKVIDGDKALVVFKSPTTAKYAFDQWQPVYKKNSTIGKEYERIPCVNGGLNIHEGNYYVSAKAIAPALTDTILAIVRKPAGSTISKDSIQFVNGKGTRFPKISLNDSTFAIQIVGGPEKDAQEIYAVYKQSSAKTFNLGKLLVASYPIREYSVKLIPVNGAVVNLDSVKTALNRIYKPICISWTVTLDSNFVNNSWDIDHDNKLNVTGTSIWSVLTEEMKALNNAYYNERVVDRNTIYLFALTQAATTTNGVSVLGDMPRGKQFGYLFTGNGNDPGVGKTAAHEIGHGVFKLKHVFDYDAIHQGDLIPQNVMDYPSGEFLVKHQWDFVFDPALVINLFESDANGQSIIVNNIGTRFLNPDRISYTFMTPNGTYITLDSSTFNHVFFYGLNSFNAHPIPTGTLTGFSKRDGVTTVDYVLKWMDTDPSLFNGYVVEGTSTFAPETLYKTGYADSVVIGLPYSETYDLIKVRAAGLLNYKTNRSTTFFPEKNFTFNPFVNPIPGKNRYAVNYQSAPQIFGNESWSINPNYVDLLKAHENKSEMLIVEKIIQLKTLYPGLFRTFSYYFDDWNNPAFSSAVQFFSAFVPGVNITLRAWDKNVKETPALKAEWTSNPKLYYTKFHDSLIVFIRNFEHFKNNLLASLDVNTPAVILMSVLEKCSDPDVQNMSALKRLQALSILASNKAVFDQDYERQSVRLINLTPVTQSDSVLTGLKGDNLLIPGIKLLRQLIYINDDSFLGFGDDNYKNLIVAISKVAVRSNEFNQKASQLSLDNFMDYYVDFSYKTIWRRLWNNGVGIPYVKSSASVDYGAGKVKFKNEYVYKGIGLPTPQTKDYDLFEPIWLARNKSLSMLRDISSDATGTLVPALVLKYADDKGDVKTTGDIINAVIDAASLASGYGAIVKGVTGMRRALVVVDMIGSGVSLVDNLSGGYLQANYPKAFAVMNALSAVAGVAQFGKWGNQLPPISNVDDISDIYNAIKNTEEAFPTVSQASEFCDKIIDADVQLQALSPAHLAVTKKVVSRLLVEADELGSNTLAGKARAAINKLHQVFDGPWDNFLNDFNDWDIATKNIFRAEVDADGALKAIFIEASQARKAELAKGWKFIIDNTSLRKDPKILQSVGNLIRNNEAFVTANKVTLNKIIDNLGLAGAKCRTCPANTQNMAILKPYMKYLDEYIADLDYGISKFEYKTGFDKLLTEMQASDLKADGGSFMLSWLKNKGEDFADNIESFEDFYLSGTKLEADLKIFDGTNTIFFEFKSYKKNSWDAFSSGQTFNQLKGYLRSGNKFEYIANKTKLLNEPGITDPLKFVKEKFQQVFKNENYKFYDNLIAEFPNAFSIFNINNKAQFIQKVNSLNSDLFAFIKVE